MQDASASAAANPLVRLAESVPARAALLASIALRLVGAAAALYLAFDQSYDPTQAMTIGIAVAVATSLAPVGRAWGAWLSAFGSGAVFFGGALLLSEAAGLVMLISGALAGGAVVVAAHRDGSAVDVPVAGFFVAAAAAIGGIAIILFTIEG